MSKRVAKLCGSLALGLWMSGTTSLVSKFGSAPLGVVVVHVGRPHRAGGLLLMEYLHGPHGQGALAEGGVTPLLPAGAIALLTVCVNWVVDWQLHRASGLKE